MRKLRVRFRRFVDRLGASVESALKRLAEVEAIVDVLVPSPTTPPVFSAACRSTCAPRFSSSCP